MSTTGTRPVTAAPKAEPTMAASEMGALRTRSGPNSSISPLVTPNGRPRMMSSPMQYTRASRRISSRSARFSASPKSSFMTWGAPTWPRTPPSARRAPGNPWRSSVSLVCPWIVREQIRERVFRPRQRTRFGIGDRVLDRCHDGFADARRLCRVEQMPLDQEPLEARDRIALSSLGDLVLAAIRLGIALEMTDPADRVRLDQRRPVAATSALRRTRHHVVNGQHVVAVDTLARNAVAGAAGRDGAARRRERVRGGRRPAVVLAHEYDGELPQRSEVDALVKRPAIGGAVAEERDDDLTRPTALDRH